MLNRRDFLLRSAVLTGSAMGACGTVPSWGQTDLPGRDPKLSREVGITTSSLSGHLAAKPAAGQFSLLELPRIMRDELDMRVIDLNTSSLASTEPKYLEQVREAAAKANVVLTNLKLNQRGLDMNSADEAARSKAMDAYKKSIDAAARLGLRWVRPLPLKERPDMQRHVAAYRELAQYGQPHNISLLVENYGWMEDDPASVVQLVKAIGGSAAACPDTGNWANNEVRYAGLKQTFPLAVSCDYKFRELTPDGEHPLYDLQRTWEIGWRAGFRGPWCLEHANRDRATLFKELALVRDQLRSWMKAAA